MKQQDIALIVVVVFISAVGSIFFSKMVIDTPKNRSAKVEVVDKIVADFPALDKRYFNDKSIDPTQLIHIGNNDSQDPFREPL